MDRSSYIKAIATSVGISAVLVHEPAGAHSAAVVVTARHNTTARVQGASRSGEDAIAARLMREGQVLGVSYDRFASPGATGHIVGLQGGKSVLVDYGMDPSATAAEVMRRAARALPVLDLRGDPMRAGGASPSGRESNMGRAGDARREPPRFRLDFVQAQQLAAGVREGRVVSANQSLSDALFESTQTDRLDSEAAAFVREERSARGEQRDPVSERDIEDAINGRPPARVETQADANREAAVLAEMAPSRDAERTSDAAVSAQREAAMDASLLSQERDRQEWSVEQNARRLTGAPLAFMPVPKARTITGTVVARSVEGTPREAQFIAVRDQQRPGVAYTLSASELGEKIAQRTVGETVEFYRSQDSAITMRSAVDPAQELMPQR